MFIHFHIKEGIELFTTYEYKQLLEKLEKHFVDENKKQGIQVAFAKAYFNPCKNDGSLEYEFINCDEQPYIPDYDFPNGNDILTVMFY